MFGGIIARTQGDLSTAQTFLERCVAIYRTLDDDLGLAYGLANFGITSSPWATSTAADATLTESLALARSAGDPNLLCVVLAPLGTLAFMQGQHDRAMEFLRESVTVGRTVQRAYASPFSRSRADLQLGRALFEQGKFDEAMLVFEDALAGPEAPVAGVTLSQAPRFDGRRIRRDRPATPRRETVWRRRRAVAREWREALPGG